MTRNLFDLLEPLTGHHGVDAVDERADLDALELVTTDADGWPHVAWLSAGEVLPVDQHSVGLCLWPQSTTSTNLQRDGKALLQGVQAGDAFKARLECRLIGEIEAAGERFLAFRGTQVALAHDEVSYADVLSGARYRLHDSDGVARRWRAQLESLAAVIDEASEG